MQLHIVALKSATRTHIACTFQNDFCKDTEYLFFATQFGICSSLTTVTFFSAWDKSLDSLAKSWKLEQIAKTQMVCQRSNFPLLTFGWSIKDRLHLSIDNGVPHSGMLLYLHHRDSKIFFHPAKFDNFKDEKISDFKTVSVSQSKNLLDWKLVV